MNGWFYINGNKKSASWTGVDFLRNFLVQKKHAKERIFHNVEELSLEVKNEGLKIGIGDIIQLSNNGLIFNHSVIVTEINDGQIFICCHTRDEKRKNLRKYEFKKARFLKMKI